MNSFMHQTLKLIKQNGLEFDNIKASVQKKIFINDITLPVEEGDVFLYKQPSGLLKELVVEEVDLYNTNSLLDHYEIGYSVKKPNPMTIKNKMNKQSRVELFEKYDFHPTIKAVSFDQFQKGFYKDAILNAFIEVINHVKVKAGHPKDANGRDLDGDSLMGHVFGCDGREPILKLNDLASTLDSAEQRGFMNLYKGICGLRDKKAHLNFLQNDPLKTVEYLSLASLLCRLVDEAEVNI